MIIDKHREYLHTFQKGNEKAIIKLFLYCIRMEITVLYFKFCVHKSWFTVANICLPSDNLCIAYDDDKHYTPKH